uniref:GCN5-like N-acetyltransferase n=1 Tax=Porphyridium aerugineum TaxID=2792 RepID=UPI001FCD6A37|nr:GCN5-like N-acetyltransferase [Porphyridium aerugineum]UNJ17919.1 GCN5-like N-acetyltransferase [Porphyridium aerugineum]
MPFWKNFFTHLGTNTDNDVLSNNKNILIKTINYNDIFLDIYASQDRKINLQEIENLFISVGWIKRPSKRAKVALNNSFLVITLLYTKANHKHIIGFARATSDHAFNATIWDVVIHPSFQGYGLGKLLLSYLIDELRKADISTITLFADSNVIDFYKNLGFVIDPDNTKGMFWYPQ